MFVTVFDNFKLQIQYIAKNDWETWNERNARLNKQKKMSASELRDKKSQLERQLEAAREEQDAPM